MHQRQVILNKLFIIFASMISTVQNWFKNNKLAIFILLFFACIYSAISLVNHYNFRTYAMDLGIFNHALYSYSHGKMNYFTLDLTGKSPFNFSDHFSPLTILYSPFYYLFGSWTLLIIQIICVLFGAWGCYRVAQIKIPRFSKPFFIVILFLSQFGITSALAFDFHNNVVAAMLMPWFYLFYINNEKKKVILIFLMMLIAKENIALWLPFIILGCMLEKGLQKNSKSFLTFEIPLILFSLVYFYIIVSYVMPAFSGEKSISQLSRYGELGDSFGEILVTLVTHPLDTVRLLFESPYKDSLSYGIKKELHIVLLLSGGFAFLLRPAYLIMTIPIFAQKLFASNYGFWGISAHYSVEFAPIIALAFIDLIQKLTQWKFVNYLIFATVLSTIVTNLKTLDTRKTPWYDSTENDYTSAKHYSSGGLDCNFIRTEIAKIPDRIPLSVSSCLAPHLANRDKLYHFPIIKDAKLLVLIKDKRSPYPLNREDFNKKVNQLITSKNYKIILDKNNLLILRRIEK